MTSNVLNQVPYLRTSREFPEEMQPLTVELTKAYIDTANAINVRTIGIFPITRRAITGESWYIFQNEKQQTFRQVFTFTTTATITHGIPNLVVTQPTRCFGSYTDSINAYGLTRGTTVAVAGLIMFYVTPTQIIFTVGAGAPAMTSGRIVIEWLSPV